MVDIWDFHRLFPADTVHIGDIKMKLDKDNRWRGMVVPKGSEGRSMAATTYMLESLGEFLFVERIHVLTKPDYAEIQVIGFIVDKLNHSERTRIPLQRC